MASSSFITPSRYLVDHLFLLIGGNPLPNYVAARSLLKPNGTVHLIHSEAKKGKAESGTRIIAERLRTLLEREQGIKFAPLIAVDEAMPHSIFSAIAARAAGCAEDETIGLNYTGGTKSMAVHAYRAIQTTKQKKVFSYLDAREMSLKIEPIGSEVLQSIQLINWHGESEIGKPPNIRTLTALHGEILSANIPNRDTFAPEIETMLAYHCSDPIVATSWRSWCDEELRKKTRNDNGDDWKKEAKLKTIILNWPDAYNPNLHDLSVEWRKLMQMESATELDLCQAKLALAASSCESVCRWLDGLWLEYYVLKCVEQVATEVGIHDWGRSIDTNKNTASHDFEMDIAAMRSYRLFTISCTTDMRYSKLKLFEAMTRGQQLGGDEAHIGLVSFASETERLQKTASEDWRGNNAIRVFGPADLAGLSDKLKFWFSQGD